MGETLRDRSKRNLSAAIFNYSNICEDDFYLNVAGYLLQQSVELFLKHNLEINGVPYIYTHNITKLLDQVLEENIKLNISSDTFEQLYDMSETFTSWESKTRCIRDYFLTRRKLDRALDLVKRIFNEDDESSEITLF